MSTVGFVFARGGSKGVPRKNLRMLAGKPLVVHAVETALQSRLLDYVFVSTDDPEIAREAAAAGALVPFLRPAHLATDRSPELLAWQHAIRTCRDSDELPDVDTLVSIPPTSPLRSAADIDRCIAAYRQDEAHVDVVVTVTRSTHNPRFNMVTIDADRRAHLVIDDGGEVLRRQDAACVYDVTPVAAVARPDFVLSATRCFDGRVRAVEIPRERALEIDSTRDLEFAEFLYQRRQHGTRPERKAG